jgi:hypothetical protein
VRTLATTIYQPKKIPRGSEFRAAERWIIPRTLGGYNLMRMCFSLEFLN